MIDLFMVFIYSLLKISLVVGISFLIFNVLERYLSIESTEANMDQMNYLINSLL
ncbi:hypothetical protein N752_23935 [Desulforamulus aquiferis]|nr:hypothetical protein [Desulforamulus aquiferis]RYD02385.1 hypothetical protein N752_23935 [Desulforamulus aquiferis]